MNANELMGELVADHKAEIIEKAASKLAGRLAKVCLPDAEKLFRQKMEKAAEEMVAKQLADLSATTFRDTDAYGQSRGGPDMTLLEVVMKKAGDWLQLRVTYNGNPSRDRDDPTRAQWLVNKEAEALVKAELAPAIKQAKADLKAEIETKLSKAFLDTLKSCR